MTPGPGRRQCTEYLRPGPGGMPLALPLSEGLGRTLVQTGGFTALMLPLPSQQREEGTRDLAVPRKFAAPDPKLA